HFSTPGDMVSTLNDGTQVTYNNGDMAWLLDAQFEMIVPNKGFFYSGLMRRKNALNQIFLSMAVYAVVTFVWFFWGYSLAFSESAGKFIGDLKHFGLMNVLDQPSVASSRIPALLFCVFQLMFATITPVLALGATAERGRVFPALVFTAIWSTIVYSPIACWYWNPNGWVFKLGALDFAGGGPVHMTSGTAALAYSIYLGKRRGWGTDALRYRPNNVAHVVIGTVFLWFGWFGFNAGSALAADLRATQAAIVTNMAASVGALVWCTVDFIFERKFSVVGFCSGAIAGLIGITPAAGYVGTPAAVAIGVLVGIGCNFATKLKFIFKYDDTIDIFATHAVGGFIGALATGLFADSRVAGFDGTEIDGGFINKHYIQRPYQLAGASATIGYTFVVTMLILVIMDHIPGLSLRVSIYDESESYFRPARGVLC
ncbi:ammonium transporter, partial [Meredithblackwellia eburnea MCA 4105]